jgi:hypothetical protein
MFGNSASCIGNNEADIGFIGSELAGPFNLITWLFAGGPRAGFQREGNLP